MTDNAPESDEKEKDGKCIARAVKALKKAYLRHTSWRMVAQEFGVNQSYIWRLVTNGMVPKNPDIRYRLGLPRVLPSERKPRKRREVPKIGQPGWEKVYFKK